MPAVIVPPASAEQRLNAITAWPRAISQETLRTVLIDAIAEAMGRRTYGPSVEVRPDPHGHRVVIRSAKGSPSCTVLEFVVVDRRRPRGISETSLPCLGPIGDDELLLHHLGVLVSSYLTCTKMLSSIPSGDFGMDGNLSVTTSEHDRTRLVLSNGMLEGILLPRNCTPSVSVVIEATFDFLVRGFNMQVLGYLPQRSPEVFQAWETWTSGISGEAEEASS